MKLKYINEKSDRLSQLEEGVGKNQFVRSSEYNDLIYFLKNLNLLTNATDDSDAATKGIKIGDLYRTGSIIKVRVN